MTKVERRRRKKDRQDHRAEKRLALVQEERAPPEPTHKPPRPLEARSEAQGHYLIAIRQGPLTFGVGPAGTGKTYIATALAAEALASGKTRKLILTRPAVEAGESLGFLPGELEQKFDPYMAPFREVLNERLGRSQVDYMIKRGQIETLPLAYMRGRTFRNCWVILDEAQNVSPAQMKMFLTRIGEWTHAIVNGDPEQTDIEGPEGLTDAIKRLQDVAQMQVIEFKDADIVRSGLVADIVKAYRKAA